MFFFLFLNTFHAMHGNIYLLMALMLLQTVKYEGPTVKRGTDCGMDSFRGLTGSESML